MTMRIPVFYTYLVRCIPTNELYYGVRYSKNANPSEFWKTYFTSSNHIAERIKLFGLNSFEFEIRKTFSCPYAARTWETRVLTKIKAVSRPDFLNRTHGLCFRERCSKSNKKMLYIFDEESYKWIDNSLVEAYVNSGKGIIKGPPKTNSAKLAISAGLTGKKKTPTHLQRISDARKGIPLGPLEDRLGEEKAAEINNARRDKLIEYYKTHTHPAKGITYEERYGKDEAEKLKMLRSNQLKLQNPSSQIKGKTYEEMYGKEKAAHQKLIRSTGGKKNSKTYVVTQYDNIVFSGTRMQAVFWIASFVGTSVTNSNILYNTNVLLKHGLSIETQHTPR